MPGRDLKYAVSDAKRVASTLHASAHYSGVKIEKLLDQAASADTIKARRYDIVEGAQPGVTIMLAFAGHGLLDSHGRLKVCTVVDDNEGDRRKRSISTR